MQNGLTFAGVLIAGIGWMLLLFAALVEELAKFPQVPGFSVPGLPLFEVALAATACGLMLAAAGLRLGARERPTKRRHPRRTLTPEDFRYKTVIKTELQTDGRTKCYYEGGETEIF
jgi:hypothetical protein